MSQHRLSRPGGIYELVTMSVEMQSGITQGADLTKLRELARKDGFRTMFEDGVEKSMLGLTTLEEVLRVTQN